MKVVILAGGYGTRISEESHLKPKPMIGLGEMPILWHIMKIYSSYGFNDFIICLGYKAYVIKEYFAHYYLHEADVTFDFRNESERVVHSHTAEPWKVTLVNTGLHTMTGGRIKKIQEYVGNETFMLTYGDGVADVNINDLVRYHKKHGKMVTVTASQPSARFGSMTIDDTSHVIGFKEKPKGDNAWVNAGFFVIEPGFFKYLKDDTTILEREPLEKVAEENHLVAYKHTGFWQPMDTLRDKIFLEELWQSGKAPWKTWRG